MMSNAHRGFKTPLLAERLFFLVKNPMGFFSWFFTHRLTGSFEVSSVARV